jgi:hypothetical protein
VPITVERDNRRRWLRATGTGNLRLDELLTFLRTARAGEELRMWPMVFDGMRATTGMTEADAARAVAAVIAAVAASGPRAHVAVITNDDPLYGWMLAYETRCAAAGIRLIRVFRQMDDGERWLDIVSAARNLQ